MYLFDIRGIILKYYTKYMKRNWIFKNQLVSYYQKIYTIDEIMIEKKHDIRIFKRIRSEIIDHNFDDEWLEFTVPIHNIKIYKLVDISSEEILDLQILQTELIKRWKCSEVKR